MISHISGKLLERTPTYVVIDCNGIGYKLHISLQTYSSISTDHCKLLTHLSIKEDSHTLYGFYSEEERQVFRQLISVSGVGPSTARMILSTYSAEEIVSYIISADVGSIQSVKDRGLKCKFMVLEFGNKLESTDDMQVLDYSNAIDFNSGKVGYLIWKHKYIGALQITTKYGMYIDSDTVMAYNNITQHSIT